MTRILYVLCLGLAAGHTALADSAADAERTREVDEIFAEWDSLSPPDASAVFGSHVADRVVAQPPRVHTLG